MADEGRQRRTAERIRSSVTNTLERKVKDPRLGFLTITDVRVTGDLQHATIYYTVMGDEKEERKTTRALNSAKGLIRSEVGAALGTRLTPTIEFVLDALPESAASIEEALRLAKARDAEIAAGAEGKQFAGDPDPYQVDKSEQENTEVASDQSEELKDLDQAWSDWDKNSKELRDVDKVEKDLEDPKLQLETDYELTPPGGTPQV